MKKKLEAELMSIAHRILQLKNKTDIHELKAITGVLYEKLSVLSFAEKHFEGLQPTLGKKQVEEALDEKSEEVSPEIEPKVETKKVTETTEDDARPDGTQHNTESITEPNTEKIKDIVAQMPPESERVDEVLENILPRREEQTKNDFRDIGVSYDDLPQFEPVSKNNLPSPKKEETSPKSKKEESKHEPFPEFEPKPKITKNGLTQHKKSLNERLKKGINIGLNDRLAYIKHLFKGNAADYNRVLSQLNTIESFEEAKTFIDQVVKPDYDHWENKEDFEKRFLKVIENKFE